MLDQIKSHIRRYRTLENITYYFYTRITYFFSTLHAFWLWFIIFLVQRSIIRKEIVGINLRKQNITMLELSSGGKFYWTPQDRNNLIGLGLKGEWELEETTQIKKLVNSGDIVIDIGANYGLYTVLFSQLVGKRGQVHSFEPLRSMVNVLHSNLILNNVYNATVIQKAISDKEGRSTIYIPKDMSYGAASLRKRNTTNDFERCKLITIDSYVAKKRLKKVNFIKCDIEGGEYPAFKGAKNTLQEFKPALMFEVIRSASERFGYFPETLFAFLRTMGYSFYVARDKRLAPLTDIGLFHGNCFAIHKLKEIKSKKKADVIAI